MKSAIKKFRLAGGMMLVVLAALLGCGGGRLKRLPESGFQVAFESRKVASEMKSGKSVSADITVKNTSPSLGRASPTIKIALPLTLPTTGKGETQSLLTVCGCPWPET